MLSPLSLVAVMAVVTVARGMRFELCADKPTPPPGIPSPPPSLLQLPTQFQVHVEANFATVSLCTDRQIILDYLKYVNTLPCIDPELAQIPIICL